MIVVADTGPVNYLVRLGYVTLLRELYERVLLPAAVHAELMHEGSPTTVREWAAGLPVWVEVRSAKVAGDAFVMLDPGEREAIILAMELSATVLMDELEGRTAAITAGVPVTGTLGVLASGAQRGSLDFEDTLTRLAEMRFRMSESVRNEALRLANKR